MSRLLNPHPGEILKSEFQDEMSLTQNPLANAIGVPSNHIHAIVNTTHSVTADTDLRLSKFYGLSESYFLRLQNAFDVLEVKRRVAKDVAKTKPHKTAAA